MKAWLTPESRSRRLLFALLIYVLSTAAYFTFASHDTVVRHTPYNHFALQAEAWLDGRLDLGGPPPVYAGNNDFAHHAGKWFVVFPPFPAALLLPAVKLAGSAEKVQDGQFFLWLAGLGPAFLFLALEKLRRHGRSGRSERDDLLLTILFAFGTVYFFCAEQGTVWYAAHVVGVSLAALYLLWALEAERPLLAGLALGLGFATRSPLLFAAPLFLSEAARTSAAPGAPCPLVETRAWLRTVSWGRFTKLALAFALPLLLIVGLSLWHNQARFGDPFEVGYRYLTVVWQKRIEKWGLFDYHYLPRNLGVILASLPWLPADAEKAAAPFQINGHGLALWFTTPVFFWLLWPKSKPSPHWALWLTVALVALPSLFYQNSGWVQFGYRFSNDYAVFLFALLAIGGHKLRGLFAAAAVWAIAVNAFGAYTFGRSGFSAFYFSDASQRVIFQPD
jgi:hypothetical protein